VKVKVLELMLGIRNLDMVLPEFQREYVWEREQAKQLLVSLFKDYPTGSLLFWKTLDPPEIKNNAIDREKIGSTSVILDGQQRLTTLYLLTQNEIPPYYTEADIRTDPRNLYFDIESGDFQYYQKQRMESNPVWLPVVECFADKELNPFAIAKSRTEDESQHFALANQYNDNLNRLRNIMEKVYPVQAVPSTAGIDDAIDVFDRVNSLGTKLTDAELALAHICGKWAQARQVMKAYIATLEERHFHFSLTFTVRCLTAVIRGRALYETIHNVSADEAKDGWQRLTKTVDYLTAILPKYGHIHSTADLNTTNVLVPLVAHVSKFNKFQSDAAIRRAIHWLYAANAWGRYSGQTNQRLDHDISIIQRTDNPWTELVDSIVDQRGRIELTPGDLEGRGSGHPFYRMTYIMAKAQGAVDWCNGLPLDIKQTGSYSLHSHHIFPQSRLYSEAGYDWKNHVHKKLVNEIANRAFLTADSNWTLSDDRPENYLQEVREKYPGAMEKQFVPSASGLWTMEKYEDFLRQRRKLIAEAFNALMKALLAETAEAEVVSSEALIATGESATVEFKSSLRWDVRQKCVNKQLKKVVAKAICGFLNSEGGTLLIGVSDDGTALGIQDDVQSLGRKDRDGFLQELGQAVSTYLGDSVAPYFSVEFHLLGGVEVCRVDIDPSPSGVFLADGTSKEFYIRLGSSTRPLDMEEALRYIGEKWG
jgi:hypothetical protein